jgi:CheY-like chemotaxis protein
VSAAEAMKSKKKPSEPTGEGNHEAKQPEQAELTKKIILIVDDVMVMRLMLRAKLEEAGFEVLEAEDGEKALTILEKEPDVRLIITDVKMPVMDGLELIGNIRNSLQYAAIPVIICTAKGEISVVRKAKQLGVQRFLVKPITKPALLAAIKQELV